MMVNIYSAYSISILPTLLVDTRRRNRSSVVLLLGGAVKFTIQRILGRRAGYAIPSLQERYR
jgi:hypothetical protein